MLVLFCKQLNNNNNCLITKWAQSIKNKLFQFKSSKVFKILSKMVQMSPLHYSMSYEELKNLCDVIGSGSPEI